LDVVYNHTGEGAPLSGIDHATYYSLEQGHDRNDSGCGNTLNCNHPAVIELILDSLRYFVSEFHVDGFRFDLASILTRGVGGIPLERPSLIEKITKDPLLSVTKLIAEPWDPGGLYQVGKFPSHRFGEWNDRFRDDFRSFFKGEERHEEVKKRLIGSPDLFSTPTKSYNFITIHDGFSLRDLVSYNEKHNEPNGENNRDGTSHNLSWNCGIEGNTEDEEILSLRVRQMKNFLLALFFSKGIPMLLMGDEYGHTKQGNNNTWCQDNPLSYFQWGKLEKNLSFFQWVSSLIEIRKRVFSNQDPHFEWIDCECLAVLIGDTQLLAFNPSPQPLDCPLPPNKWSVAIDTSEGQGVFNETSFTLFQRSAILLIAT
ncbi:MAG: glycogen debranching enzyme, partial [Chlamydiia bacterium]|nr:glycogen debranching enzyme [Chlamydiia bacterium]